MVQSLAFEEFHKVVLGDAWQNVATSVNSEISAPRQRQIELNVRWVFVAEFNIPELEWHDDGLMVDVEVVQLGNRRLCVNTNLLVHFWLENMRGCRTVIGCMVNRVFSGRRVLAEHVACCTDTASHAVWAKLVLRIGQSL